MGEVKEHQPVLLILVSISRYDQALNWAGDTASRIWGEVLLQSNLLPFSETKYYEPSMGADLRAQITAFKDLIDPAELVKIKIKTNALEKDYCESAQHPEIRPLNLDPGYLTPAKFVLATTKDAAHRIYLERGIFAETTLCYTHGNWKDSNWTYPNYRRDDYKNFLFEGRKLLLQRCSNHQ
jgi:hypothetical protein